MGHLTRALALARAVVRLSSSEEKRQSEDNPATHISILTNSPFAHVLPMFCPWLTSWDRIIDC
jgi:hypothetical protein